MTATVSPALIRAAQRLRVDQVTVEVISACNAEGIPTLLLKGPSIARWLYPSGGRNYIDTDILVPGPRFGRAEEVLVSLGFRPALEGFNPYELGISSSAETPYIRGAAGGRPAGVVDLHHTLPGVPTDEDVLWDAFASDSQTLRLAGLDVRVLGKSALALHVVLHAVQHGFALHTAEDLRRALAAMSVEDWKPVVDLAERLGVADVLGSGLRRDPTGADVADRLHLPVLAPRQSPFWAMSAPRGVGSLAELVRIPGARAKARAVRWALLPSPAKIRYVYALPSGDRRVLLAAYGRRWAEMARAVVPAARFMIRSGSLTRRVSP